MTSFKDQVKNWAELTERDLKDVVKNLGKGVAEEVVNGAPSPVDEGVFKANWKAQFNSPDTSYNENDMDVNGYPTIQALWAVIDSWNDFKDDLYITNPTPYGIYLEYGHSKQAPNGVVGVTVAKYNQLIKNAISKAN